MSSTNGTGRHQSCTTRVLLQSQMLLHVSAFALIESPRMPFTAIDPETDELKHQDDARVKLSPFYLDGKLTDIRFIASNKKYAVNDEDCVVGVINR